ncbi:hypothetical protein, partial [Pseudomonas bubulae]|uniref:hypothetical protein n=1 Tax=Pseudomonas bubulae TaxID=2316085 RepID=UPI002B1DB7C6
MSFALADKKLYYCIGTKTVRAWNGLNDAGSTTTTINPIFATAYSQLGTPNFKNINAIRFQSSGNTTAATINYGICT